MRCLVCGSDNTDKIAERRQIEHFSPYAVFTTKLDQYNKDILKCEECGLSFIYPMYSSVEIVELYEQYDAAAAIIKSNTFSEDDAQIWLKQLDAIGLRKWKSDFDKKFGRPPKVLDIGCGYGRILHLFDRMGCEVHGIDLNRDGIEHIRTTYGFDVEYHDFFDYKSETKYDLITLFHVIEHVRDPHLTFEKIESLLSEDGLVLLETPWADDVGLPEDRYCDIFHTLFFNHLSLFLLGAKHDFLVKATQNIAFTSDNLLSDKVRKPLAYHKFLQVLFERSAVRNELDSASVRALGATFNQMESDCSSSMSRTWDLERHNNVYKRLLEDPAMRKKVFADILRKDFKCTTGEIEKLVAVVYEIAANFLPTRG